MELSPAPGLRRQSSAEATALVRTKSAEMRHAALLATETAARHNAEASEIEAEHERVSAQIEALRSGRHS